MSRAVVVLRSPSDRNKVARWAAGCSPGTRVEFKGPKRSLPQNDRLWLMLSAVAGLEWHGHRYSAEDWKDYFMHAYRGAKWMPCEDGGMVPIGRSTSQLSKEEHGELMDMIEAFCARQGVSLPWFESEVA